MTPPGSLKSTTSASSDAATQLPNLKSLYVCGTSGFAVPQDQTDTNHFPFHHRERSPPSHERILHFLNEKDSAQERSPPPDYSSPTREVKSSSRDATAVFENGFFFPQPPSPNFLQEPPTPEFTGRKYLGFNHHKKNNNSLLDKEDIIILQSFTQKVFLKLCSTCDCFVFSVNLTFESKKLFGRWGIERIHTCALL